ncbi:MAG: aminotransferase class V-fold PLP-dependent enzyme [Patescibacteria group bacterium]|jgi:cysteine desulfurase/selenocysteine lyase
MMNLEKIRQDFPIFSKSINGQPPVYFDNACMSLKPLQVIKAMNEYYYDYPACAGRSGHKLGETVTKKVEAARIAMAEFINAKHAEEIIFTRNTTEGINLVAHSLKLNAGDIILSTDKEHNSNLIPWQILSEKIGVIHKVIKSKPDNTFDLAKFESEMTDRVKLVAMGQTSNLDGVTIPAKEIIKIAHQHGALVLLDAAQSAPHQKIDVAGLDVDFLAFSGHKMLGPTGTGILYGKKHLLEKLEPFLAGGDTVEYSTYDGHKFLPIPEKFEAGLQDYAGIIGLGEAAEYLKKIGHDNIAAEEYKLNKYITDEIIKIPKLKIIGPADPRLRSGIVSFYIEGIDSHQIAILLDETANIMIRAGQHCVHSWFYAHGIKTSARASLYFYNTMEEAEIFVTSLNKIIKIL